MALEVLLRRSVESLGRVGEVVRVRNGYARNYLFPYGIAVPPTTENLRLVEKDKEAEAVVEAEKARARAELAARLAAVTLTIEANANPEGHLFGSVGPRQIVEALAAKGFAIEERHVALEPVKQVGEYEVTVRLAADAEVKVKTWVVGPVPPEAAGKTP
jgi:large subunit ribosomal protein L9